MIHHVGPSSSNSTIFCKSVLDTVIFKPLGHPLGNFKPSEEERDSIAILSQHNAAPASKSAGPKVLATSNPAKKRERVYCIIADKKPRQLQMAGLGASGNFKPSEEEERDLLLYSRGKSRVSFKWLGLSSGNFKPSEEEERIFIIITEKSRAYFVLGLITLLNSDY